MHPAKYSPHFHIQAFYILRFSTLFIPYLQLLLHHSLKHHNSITLLNLFISYYLINMKTILIFLILMITYSFIMVFSLSSITLS